MSRGTPVLLVLVALSSASACSKAAPQLPGPVALMETPPPPARLIIPVELPEVPAVEPEPDPPAPPPAPPRQPAAAAAKPAERPTVSPPAETTPPGPVLRTSTDSAATERRILQVIDSAEQNLNRVNYRELNPGARTQYDAARSSIRMARDAVKVKNYTYADYLAARADSLARQLLKG